MFRKSVPTAGSAEHYGMAEVNLPGSVKSCRFGRGGRGARQARRWSYARRPHAEMSGGVETSSRPLSSAARWASISSAEA